MVITKDVLYDRLVNQAGFDKDEVDSFFSVYSLKDWLSAINAGDITVYRLEQKIDEWLNYENPMDESTTLTEGWTSAYDWQSADDVREALKEEEISSDWKFVKNFGNFFCYQRKDGRPLVCYYLIQKMGNREWGYKDIGVYPGMKYNAGAAAWLKNALTEYGSTAIEPGDFKGYWDWIEEGNTNKDKVSDMKNQLKAGDKVEIHGHVVIFERPYNKQAFAGHVEDENETYKWYYRDVEKVLTESMRENMEDYIREQQDYINGLCDENGFNVFFDEDTLSGVIEKDGKEVDVQFEIEGDVVTANGVEIYEFFDSFDEDIDNDFGVRQFEDPDDLEEATSLLESAGYRVINETVDIVDEVRDLLKHNGYDEDTIENEIMDYKFIDDLAEDGYNAEEIMDELLYAVYGSKGKFTESTMNEVINNPDEPASKKQLWALFCIYHKDFRNQNLTKAEASELIKKGADENPRAPKGKNLDVQIREHIETVLKPKLDKEIEKAYGMQSVVGDADLEGNLIPGRKRYKFFGSGCGFAWIKYDKRNKKLGEVIDKYIDIYNDEYKMKYAREYEKKFHEDEIGAVLCQDIIIQVRVKESALDFAKSIGINTKGAYVDSRLD